MLYADRHAHHIRQDTGCELLRGFQLSMSRARWMADEGARVANVHEVTHELR